MPYTQLVFDYQQKKRAHVASSPIPTTPVILYRAPAKRFWRTHRIGLTLILFSLGALFAAFSPLIMAEASYRFLAVKENIYLAINNFSHPKSEAVETVVAFNPLKTATEDTIIPVSTDFSVVIPKLGINSPVIPGVNPVQKSAYTEALKKGVAHASTSFYPNENGTVYLFSHSTNYEWFVKDLNAIFYLLKDLEDGDLVVLIYLNHQYTYQVRDKQKVSARDIAYLAPQEGERRLILQTCWPPGTVSQRLLVFADLVDERPYTPAAE